MHTTGRLLRTSIECGRLVVSFIVDQNHERKTIDELQDLQSVERLTIDAKKYRERRSLDANAYCWQLIDKIAKRLGVDKWTWYLHSIREYGVFQDVKIVREAVSMLQRYFRYVELFDDGYGAESSDSEGDMVVARCYFGSSKYDSKEMSDLIAGVVREAQELGIETLTPEEQQRMLEAWKGEQ
jgi:hypothetical protein